MKVALIREGKIPADSRVVLNPAQAAKVQQNFPNVQVVCQSSEIRCFTDEQYRKQGISVVQNVSDCDVLLGVKEVPIPELIGSKTYFFFSHTIKKQPYNRPLLQEILKKQITLIDYERLTNDKGSRVVAFGRFAGIVGAYNGLYTFGKRYKLYDIRRAKDCYDMEDLKKEYDKIRLPAIKIAITGNGRVARGAMEVLDGIGIRKVTPQELLNKEFEEPVYAQLLVTNYNQKKGGGTFDRKEFFKYPENFEPGFRPYTQVTDLFIACAFWDHLAPVLFYRKDMMTEDFKIKVIADITCDIEGSIPSTKQPSTIDDPVYDYDPWDDEVATAYSDNKHISVMAIDNLPSELPRDASTSFGNSMMEHVFPSLFGTDNGIVARATVTQGGELTNGYQYLRDYANGKE